MLTKDQQKTLVHWITEDPGKSILEGTDITAVGPVTRNQISSFAKVCRDILLEQVEEDVFAV